MFQAEGSKTIIATNHSGIATKTDESLAAWRLYHFIIHQADFTVKQSLQQLCIVRLKLERMAKEEVSFTRNQSVDLDFFNPDEDITIIQIFLKLRMVKF